MTDSNQEVIDFGRKIFERIGREQPSIFTKQHWSNQIMEWSMRHPEFKVNLFRLVDVLPTLKSRTAVAEHMREYLGSLDSPLSKIPIFNTNVNPRSIRGQLMATAIRKGVRGMAEQFIAGEDAASAVSALRKLRKSGLAFTVDLLGEFTLSEREAEDYLARYLDALSVLGEKIPGRPESAPIVANHFGEKNPVSVSVKLTALYSQCSPLNFSRSVDILSSRLSTIVARARQCGASVYVDAEDTASNPIIYETFKRVFGGEHRDVAYPGIVVQAYSKTAGKTIEDLLSFAKQRGSPIAIRLVKGAYWDYETITARLNDWDSPLFTRKESSDANYEHLSATLLDNNEHCLPAFGSHNIRSLSYACCYAKKVGLSPQKFELQMLYGMADPIARAFSGDGYLVRMYVPLGNLFVGMGYLVRRLLENTSNESFLRHTFFDAHTIDALLAQPNLSE